MSPESNITVIMNVNETAHKEKKKEMEESYGLCAGSEGPNGIFRGNPK